MRRTIASAIFGSIIAAGAANATICDSGTEIWEIEDRGLRYEFTRSSEVGSYGPVLFTAFEGDRRLWQIEGEYGCSNGIVVCSVSIPTSGAEPIQASETVIYGPELVEYVVFADLYQSAAYRQLQGGETLTAEVFGTSTIEEDGIKRLPSYYQFIGCDQ